MREMCFFFNFRFLEYPFEIIGYVGWILVKNGNGAREFPKKNLIKKSHQHVLTQFKWSDHQISIVYIGLETDIFCTGYLDLKIKSNSRQDDFRQKGYRLIFRTGQFQTIWLRIETVSGSAETQSTHAQQKTWGTY